MCACMCAYVHANTRTDTHMHTHLHTCARTQHSAHACMRIRMITSMSFSRAHKTCICAYAYTSHMHTQARTPSCIMKPLHRTRVYKRTCKHAHIHCMYKRRRACASARIRRAIQCYTTLLSQTCTCLKFRNLHSYCWRYCMLGHACTLVVHGL